MSRSLRQQYASEQAQVETGVTLVPSGDQAHLSGFFSKLCAWPVNTLTQRLAGAYGLMSHARSVLSCEPAQHPVTPPSLAPRHPTASRRACRLCNSHKSAAASHQTHNPGLKGRHVMDGMAAGTFPTSGEEGVVVYHSSSICKGRWGTRGQPRLTSNDKRTDRLFGRFNFLGLASLRS